MPRTTEANQPKACRGIIHTMDNPAAAERKLPPWMPFWLSLPTAGNVDYCNLQRGSTNKLCSPLVYNFILIPSMAASSNPFRRGSRGWGMFLHQNHAAGGENGSSWLGCLCDVCLASKKSFEREFFVPAGTQLAVKLLRIWKKSFVCHVNQPIVMRLPGAGGCWYRSHAARPGIRLCHGGGLFWGLAPSYSSVRLKRAEFDVQTCPDEKSWIFLCWVLQIP